MDKAFDKVWSNCLEIIKDIVEWQHFKTWFEPIKPVALKEKILTIQVPSQFFYSFVFFPTTTVCDLAKLFFLNPENSKSSRPSTIPAQPT